MTKEGRMYKDTKAWNPFVGCGYQCVYCKPSYQKLVAWNGRCLGCDKCQTFTPHEHKERLNRIPRDKTIFVCSNGDISFARASFIKDVLKTMRNVPIPEPSWEKTLGLMCSLRNVGIQVLPKLIPKVAYKDHFA